MAGSDDLTLLLSLDERLAAPADRAAASMDRFGDNVDKAAKSLAKFEGAAMDAYENAGKFFSELDHKVNLVDRLKNAMESLAEVGFKLGEKAAEWAYDATSFKENTMLALEAISGSTEAANDYFNFAQRFAGFAPFETKSIAKLERQLVVSGFNPDEVKTLMSASTDVGALNDMDPAAAASFAGHIGRVKMRGGMDERILKEFTMDGIAADKIMEKLAKRIGTDVVGAQTAMKNKTASANDEIAAVLDVLEERGHGELGNLTYKTSQTVAGLWSTLKSRPFELFQDVDKGPGWDKMRSLFSTLVTELDPNGSPEGAKLKANVEDFFDTVLTDVFGGISEGDAKGTIDRVLDGISDGIRLAADGFDQASVVVKSFVKGFEDGWGPLNDLFGDDGLLSPEGLKELASDAQLFGAELGLWAKMLKDVVENALLLRDVSESLLGFGAAGSDSRLADRALDAMGFKQPKPGDQPEDFRANFDRNALAGAGSKPQVTASQTNHIVVHGAQGDDPETLARKMKEQQGSAGFLDMFESLMHETGISGA